MRFAPSVLMLLVAVSSVAAQAQDQEAGARRQRAFETWGDAWFAVKGTEDYPTVYHHIEAKKCPTCDGKDWVVTVERYLPLSMTIALMREALHVDDAPGLRLRRAVIASFDDPYRDSVRITYGDSSVKSEVELCLSASNDIKSDFVREHTWKMDCAVRLGDPGLAPKLAELMVLDGTESLKFNVLVDRKVMELTLTSVGEAEISLDGRKEKTRLVELSAPGEKETVRYWVSPERGLLQFSAGRDNLALRVPAETAKKALAELQRKAEEERKAVEEEAENPKKKPQRGRLLHVRMTCGPNEDDVVTTIENRESKNQADAEKILSDTIAAFKEAGDDFTVVVDADPKVPWKRVIAVMDACKKQGVTKVELAPPKPGRTPEPPEMPVFESSWSQLNFEGVRAGDWVEYEDGGRRERVVLLKVTGKTVWIETNAAPIPTDHVFIVELDASSRKALRAWRGDPGGEGAAIKLQASRTEEWTEEEKKEFEASKPKFSNRTGSVARETLKVGERELDCEKVVQDQDVEEKNSYSPGSSKYHDRWTTWYSEDVPPFRKSPGAAWAAEIKWASGPPQGKGGEVRMTRSDEKGKVRWETRLVAWGHDGKASLKVKELEEAR